jgi:hypothetical protein
MAEVWCGTGEHIVYSPKPVARRPQLPRPEIAALAGPPATRVRLPVGDVLGIGCLSRGRLLLQAGRGRRVDRLVLVDARDTDRFTVLAAAPEPAEAATLGLLGYVSP